MIAAAENAIFFRTKPANLRRGWRFVLMCMVSSSGLSGMTVVFSISVTSGSVTSDENFMVCSVKSLMRSKPGSSRKAIRLKRPSRKAEWGVNRTR